MSMTHRLLWVLIGGTARVLAAQPAITALRPADVRFDAAEFTQLSAIRELRDQRVIVLDEKEPRLLVLRPGSRDTARIGRVGSGPGEYRMLHRLIALPDDSTIAAGVYANRFFLLSGTAIAATVTAAEPIAQTLRMTIPEGSAPDGRVVASVFPRPTSGDFRPPDSVAIVRIDRGTLRTDTVTRVSSGLPASLAQAGMAPAGGGAPARNARLMVSLETRDQIAVFPDGWVAVARVSPYRVDWCAPRAACVIGPTIESAVRLTVARQRAVLREIGEDGTTPLDQTDGWPSAVPPFVMPRGPQFGNPLLPLPSGELLVERVVDENARRPYDVVDRRGRVVRRVHVPLNLRIVGVGARSVYTATTDDDGVQRLARHPWP
jgi:hypothetical protein